MKLGNQCDLTPGIGAKRRKRPILLEVTGVRQLAIRFPSRFPFSFRVDENRRPRAMTRFFQETAVGISVALRD
jgi:hypothetical protein